MIEYHASDLFYNHGIFWSFGKTASKILKPTNDAKNRVISSRSTRGFAYVSRTPREARATRKAYG